MQSRIMLGTAALIGAAAAGFFVTRKSGSATAKEEKKDVTLRVKPTSHWLDKHDRDDNSTNGGMIATMKVTDFVAEKFGKTRDQIQYSELFETSVLKYISKLNPDAVPVNKLNVDGQAEYAATTYSVRFHFKRLTLGEVTTLALVLEDYFPGIQTAIMPNITGDNHYWLCCNKQVFLENLFPKLLANVVPEKVRNPAEPRWREEPHRFAPGSRACRTTEAAETDLTTPRLAQR